MRSGQIDEADIMATLTKTSARALGAYVLVTKPDGTVLHAFGEGLSSEDAMASMGMPRAFVHMHGHSRVDLLDLAVGRFIEVTTPVDTGEPLDIHVGHADTALIAIAIRGVIPAMLAVAASVLVTILTLGLVARSMRYRIRSLEQYVAQVADGGFPTDTPYAGSDEVGKLAIGLRDMVASLRARDVEVRQLTSELTRQASRDSLTSALNHGAFGRAIWQRIGTVDAEPAELVLTDIDQFRLINDTYGHVVGDRVLRWVAEACAWVAGPEAPVGRYAADAFTVWLPDGTAAAFLENVHSQLAEIDMTEFGAHDFVIDVTTGIARYPDHGRTPDALLAHADAALRQARFGINSPDPGDPDQAEAARLGEGFDTLVGLVAAVDAKDCYTMRHSELVATYAVLLTEAADAGVDTRRQLRLAGSCMTSAKIAVPDAILKKPGRLTDTEMAVMRAHVEVSEILVFFAIGDRTINEVATYHHERWDGSGYPRGLGGDEVPLVGRIMIIADAMSAKTLDRPYRRALTVERALEEIEAAAGTQFDPELVPIFTAAVRRWHHDASPPEAKPQTTVPTPSGVEASVAYDPGA